MLGAAKIGSGVGAADLAKRIVDIALEVDAEAHLVDEFDVARSLDHSPAARDEQAALGGEALEGLSLERAETLLALGLEDLRDRLAALALDEAIGVDETPMEHTPEVAGERGLARPQESDEEDMVASALHGRGHGSVTPRRERRAAPCAQRCGRSACTTDRRWTAA